jgi:translation initiation factor IF-3
LIDREVELRINDQITDRTVRLIDAQGRQVGVVPTDKAREQARDAGLDLVEVAPEAKPAVCKLLDYGKHKYRENKKRHEARARQKQIEVKEVKFRLGISAADYAVKMRNVRRFLDDGNRVKVSLWFRGREIVHQSRGRTMLEKVRAEVDEAAAMEDAPIMEGKRLQMVLMPKMRRTVKSGAEKGKDNDA